ncbi:MAG: chaplin family protein [Sciscionella sp.]
MQTWAKRGLQTALVTGGLLMLGTGIASAQENVNPDRPPSPLDGTLSVPVHVHDNAIGTPGKQINLPAYNHVFTTPNVNSALPAPLAKATDKAASPLSGVTSKLQQAAQSSPAAKALDKAPSTQAASSTDPTRGNRVSGDIAVPVDIAGNALALGGPATVNSTDDHSYSHSSPVSTDGAGGSLAGNVAKLDWALPIQITGNAIGLGGDATSHSTASQTTSVGGDTTTSGEGGGIAGNILAGAFATPVQVTGNSIAGGGQATSTGTANSDAASGGSLTTNGDNGGLAGNAGGLPVGVPLGVNGNALGGFFGQASSDTQSSASAKGGAADKAGRSGPDAYIDTTGNHSVLSGTAAGPALSGPVAANGNAGSLLAQATATGSDTNSASTGGFLSSYGENAVGSGTIVNPNLAAPTGAISNALTAGGESTAAYDNTVDSTSGLGSYTNGAGSVLSASNLAAPVAYPIDGFGNAGALVGIANAEPTNNVTAKSGGYNGTIGNDSVLTANEVEAPLAGAAEAFGNAAGTPLGIANSSVVENKTVNGGDGGNTNDDNGVASSNLVQAAGSLPVQVFSGSLAAGGISNSAVENNSQFTGGGKTEAAGKGGALAGNIVQAPVSLPAQAFGDAVSAVGLSKSVGRGVTSSQAGGPASTDGSHGALTGNVVSAPVAGAGQLFGNAVGVIANDVAVGGNQTTTTAGGPVTTNGDDGSLAGNVLTAQAVPVLQGFGNAVGVIANGYADGGNNTVATSGGDVTTSGVNGSGSGDILDFPVAFIGQGFGNGVGVIANEVANGDNTLAATAGGTDTSAGDQSKGSGIVSQHPMAFGGQIYNFAAPILANVMTTATNNSTVLLGDQPAQHIFTFDGSSLPALPATQMPTLPNLQQLSALPMAAGAASPQSAATGSTIPELPVNQVSSLPSLPTLGELPQVPALPMAAGMATPQAMSARQGTMVPNVHGLNLAALRNLTQLLEQPGQMHPMALPTAGGLPSVGQLPTAGNLNVLSLAKKFAGNLPTSNQKLPTI